MHLMMLIVLCFMYKSSIQCLMSLSTQQAKRTCRLYLYNCLHLSIYICLLLFLYLHFHLCISDVLNIGCDYM